MAANPNPGSNVYTTGHKYGAPPNNGNRAALNRDNSFSTQDYTGRALATPDATQDQTSPLALTSATSAQLIVVPPNATNITMIGSATFSFSEFGTVGAALTQSAAWPANTPVSIDTARIKNIYVSGTGTLSFFFQTL